MSHTVGVRNVHPPVSKLVLHVGGRPLLLFKTAWPLESKTICVFGIGFGSISTLTSSFTSSKKDTELLVVEEQEGVGLFQRGMLGEDNEMGEGKRSLWGGSSPSSGGSKQLVLLHSYVGGRLSTGGVVEINRFEIEGNILVWFMKEGKKKGRKINAHIL